MKSAPTLPTLVLGSVALLAGSSGALVVADDDLPPHTSSTFTVQVGGRSIAVEVLAPQRPAPRPGLIFSLATTRDSGLRAAPYSETARIALSGGHRVASFSLPCHGERVAQFGDGIAGFRAMVEADQDPFVMLAEDGRAILDECIRQKLAEPGRVGVCGTSRGGYCAFRWAAADARIGAVAGLAPVTDWRPLSEFAPRKADPRVAALALDHFAVQLVGRPLFAAIGNADGRVGTDHCARFAQRLFAEEAQRGVTESRIQIHFVDDSPGHTLHQRWRLAGAQFLVDALNDGAASAAP